jgi:hypothetical protein
MEAESIFSLMGLGIALAAVILIILIIRAIGAWMLRINDVIFELRMIKETLSAMRNDINTHLKKEDKPDSHFRYKP